ncbi:MAG: hypothetical protein ACMUHM_06535 [Thermoplasmatota archaeon]
MSFSDSRAKVLHVILGTMVLLTAINLISGEVEGHPPEDMELVYDYFNQILNVTITHTTPAPSQHYIESVEVFKNNVSVESKEYDRQPTYRIFYVEFEVFAQDNDVLMVRATCNIAGNLEMSTTVEGPKERMYIEVNPEIEGLEMGDEQDFTVNIYKEADDDPVEGVTVAVDPMIGTVSEVFDLGLGGYSFTYTAPEMEDDDIEVINITASKNGFYVAYFEFDFDILTPIDPDKIIEVTLSPRFTSIDEGETKEITVTVKAGGDYLDVDDIKVDRSGGTYSTIRISAGTFKVSFKASEVTTNRQGWLKVTAEMEGYRSGSSQISFTIVDVGTPDDDDDDDGSTISNDKGFFNTTTITILVVIILIIVGIVVFILYRRRKKVEAITEEPKY